MSSEAWFISALRAAFAHSLIPVFAMVPSKRPKVFISVERTGGYMDTFMDHPTLAVQAWAATRADAAALADEAARHVEALYDQPQVSDVRVDAIYNFPDPDSRHCRYQVLINAVITRT